MPALDLAQIGALHFAPPDPARFPCLALTRAAMTAGGTAPAVLNAANEVGDAGALLPAVLQGEEPEEGHPRRLFMPVNGKNAAFFTRPAARFIQAMNHHAVYALFSSPADHPAPQGSIEATRGWRIASSHVGRIAA